MVVDTLNRYANEKGHVYLKDYLKEQQEQEPKSRPFHYRPLKVLQIALADEGLVELFVLDFINKGYLFAIILNDANRRHGSCTLRILHSDQGKLIIAFFIFFFFYSMFFFIMKSDVIILISK